MPFCLSPTPRILFISDAHLGAFSNHKEKQVESDLISLIEYAQSHDYQIAVLGDLFDYWLEYSHFTPQLGKNVLQAFTRFNQKKGPALYITGNHDNWTMGHFAACGFDVELDARLLPIQQRNVLLTHGDAIGDDWHHLQRPLFHRIIRNTTFMKLYRGLLPPQTGLEMMKIFSRLSTKRSRRHPEVSKLDDWAEKMLHDNDIDVVICGHDHVPRIKKYNFGTYINLGTFHTHKTLATYNNGVFSLVIWNRKQEQLCSFHSQHSWHE